MYPARWQFRPYLRQCFHQLLFCSLALVAPLALADTSGPVVSTANGRLEGLRAGDLELFRGIPYAAPPVGSMRWRAPQAAPDWQGVRKAQAFGPACLQKVAAQEPERSLKDFPQSEDCLTLNIWAPAGARTAASKLPVMVWIHGGSFRFGSGSLSLYDGSDLARQGVIVITVNYRLGLFGSFAHPALLRQDEPGGNFGLLDGIAALRWVKTNITGFGGDPRNITLFGESAGGVSVGYLLTSPLTEGLFQRAIIESGGLSIPEFSRQEAEKIALRVSSDLHATTAEALRALSPEALRDASTGAGDTMPFIDGKVIAAKLGSSFAQGKAHAMPLLIGSNDAEAGFFGPRYWQNLPAELGPERWKALAGRCFGYADSSPDACAEQIASEWFAGANSRSIARSAGAYAPVYVYRFEWVPPAQRQSSRGAIHTAEIPYVFGHIAADTHADPASRAVSRELSARWVAFARSGKPQLKPGDWPAFSPENTETIMSVDAKGIHPGMNPADAMLDMLDSMALPVRT